MMITDDSFYGGYPMPQLGPLRWGTTRLLGDLGTTGGRNLNQSTMGEWKKWLGEFYIVVPYMATNDILGYL